jgi:D-glycerate 3-kinase
MGNGVSKSDCRIVAAVVEQVQEALRSTALRPVVIGLCGAQGSGKTTLAKAVAASCADHGHSCATLSLDDLYLTRAERNRMARKVHPLLATRGVPGTHDVGLGLSLIDSLQRGQVARLPRFDKARDDREPPDHWPCSPVPCDVLIFEGWCVGARPQSPEELVQPVNALEQDEDAEAAWRRYVNAALAGSYQTLFARIHRLVLLAAPGFEVVHRWRLEQERELAASAGAGIMDEAGVARFISHYERLTRHILREMPRRADLVIWLDERRRPVSIER